MTHGKWSYLNLDIAKRKVGINAKRFLPLWRSLSRSRSKA